MDIELLREKTLYIKTNLNLISDDFINNYFKSFEIVKIPLGFIIQEHLLILRNKKHILVAYDSEFIMLHDKKTKKTYETNISHEYSTRIETFKISNTEHDYEVSDIRHAAMNINRYLAIPMTEELKLFLNSNSSFVKDDLNEIKNIISSGSEERVILNSNEKHVYEEYLINEIIYNNPEIQFIWNTKNPYNEFISNISKLNIINFDINKISELINLKKEIIINRDLIDLYSDYNIEDFLNSIEKSICLIDKGIDLAKKTKEIKELAKIKKANAENKKLTNEEDKKVFNVFQLVPHMKFDLNFSEDKNLQNAIKKNLHIRINGKFIEVQNIKHSQFKTIINIFNQSDFIFSNYLENNIFF